MIESIKNIAKKKHLNCEKLELIAGVLVNCNLVDNQYQKNNKCCLYL